MSSPRETNHTSTILPHASGYQVFQTRLGLLGTNCAGFQTSKARCIARIKARMWMIGTRGTPVWLHLPRGTAVSMGNNGGARCRDSGWRLAVGGSYSSKEDERGRGPRHLSRTCATINAGTFARSRGSSKGHDSPPYHSCRIHPSKMAVVQAVQECHGSGLLSMRAVSVVRPGRGFSPISNFAMRRQGFLKRQR